MKKSGNSVASGNGYNDCAGNGFNVLNVFNKINIKKYNNEMLCNKILCFAKNITLYLMIFFISRVNFYSLFSVFGLSLFIASVKTKTNNTFMKISILSGMIAGCNYRCFIIALCFFAFTFLIEFKSDKFKMFGFDMSQINIIKLSIIYSFLYLMLDIFISKIFLPDNLNMPHVIYLKVLLNMLLIITSSSIFHKALKIVFRESKNYIRLTDDTVISLMFFLTLCVIGTGEIFIFSLSLKELVIIYLIEIVSFVTNGYISSVVGTILSIPLAICNKHMFNFAGISLIALFCGNVKNKSKWKYSLLFSTCFIIYYYVLADSLNLSITFITTLLLCQVFFLIVPSSVYLKMNMLFDNIYKLRRKNYYEIFKAKVASLLYSESEKFNMLANSLNIIQKNSDLQCKNSYKREIIDNVMGSICDVCVKRPYCIKNNFYKTYSRMLIDVSALFNDLSSLSMEEVIKRADNDKCLMSNDYVKKIIDEISMKNRSRVYDKTYLVKNMLEKQLFETAKSIKKTGDEVKDYKACRTHIEDSLGSYLELRGVDLDMINVFEDNKKKVEIEIAVPIRYERELSKIAKLISRFFNRVYDYKISNYNKKIDRIIVLFFEKENYNLKYGLYQTAKSGNEISGDNYSIVNFDDGYVMISLADGMGKGDDAHFESKNALELLECILALDFDDEYIVDFINSNMYEPDKEVFTTLDVAIINKNTGIAKFIKNSAMTTYIKRDNELIEINESSLPLGIVKNVKASLKNVKLEKGDQIFMITDGVIDNINSELNKKKYLKNLLCENYFYDIKKLVTQIGLKITGDNILKDDMTIIGVDVN